MSAVVVRLIGGLGNQLFCYAMAKRFALRRGMALKLDTRSGFIRDTYHRQYMLSLFRISGYEEASSWESFLDPLGRFRREGLRRASKILPLEWRPYIQQNHLFSAGNRQEDFFGEGEKSVGIKLLNYRPHNSVCLDGYWQDARLFQDVEDILQQELIPNFSLSKEVMELSAQLQSVQSVCVHVRAFQELSKSQRVLANGGRGLVGEVYYQKAFECVRERVVDPVFYCFTEQPDYARSVLPRSSDIKMIQLSRDTDQRLIDVSEFHLMSKCHHFISAQSTYLWWAAFLSSFQDKCIVVPDDVLWCNNLGYAPSGLITINGAYE